MGQVVWYSKDQYTAWIELCESRSGRGLSVFTFCEIPNCSPDIRFYTLGETHVAALNPFKKLFAPKMGL